MAERWSPYHLRLHRWLSHHPELLPDGAGVVVALSGGQDSMALLGLLVDLRRLHHWDLRLWHGNHQLRPDSSQQAAELAAWAAHQNLPIQVETWSDPRADEASARAWRYAALETAARTWGASHVATGHTASDRAETLLLQLARGSHRRGLASLRPTRPLAPGLSLSRPLLLFSRNRVRHEVLPVLEQLHPGAGRRISGVAERLAQEQESQQELVELAMGTLTSGNRNLDRRSLMALKPANQRQLLQAWLKRQGYQALPADQLQTLLMRLAPSRAHGRSALSGGVWLQWNRQHIWLEP